MTCDCWIRRCGMQLQRDGPVLFAWQGQQGQGALRLRRGRVVCAVLSCVTMCVAKKRQESLSCARSSWRQSRLFHLLVCPAHSRVAATSMPRLSRMRWWVWVVDCDAAGRSRGLANVLRPQVQPSKVCGNGEAIHPESRLPQYRCGSRTSRAAIGCRPRLIETQW